MFCALKAKWLTGGIDFTVFTVQALPGNGEGLFHDGFH